MTKATAQSWPEFFQQHLAGYRKLNDRQAQAKCPFHEDHVASLSVNIQEGLWKCHGCGKEGNGLIFADLSGISRESVPGWESRPTGNDQIVATYDYCDVDGRLLFQSVRYAPKTFRQRRPDGAGGWSWHLNGTPRVLYRLPELLKAKETESTVFIVEGEKDVETLRQQGLTATCNPMGAGKWRHDYAESLKGFLEAVVIADKDEPGRKHAQAVAQTLVGKVERVKVLDMPGDGVKDASDWFTAGGTPKQLMDLVQATTAWNPNAQAVNCAQPKELISCGIKFTPKRIFQLMNEKPPERAWLVDKYLAKGWLAVLAGHPKHGKSTLVYWLVKCVLAGTDFLGFKTKQGRVLVLAVEESIEDITDRFSAENVSQDSGLFIHCAPLKSTDVELEAIRQFIKDNAIDLVVVDTLARFWTVKDESNASEVSAATQPLLQLARETGSVVLLIHHSRKSEGDDGTEIRGSGDILAVADIGLILKKRKGSETQRILNAHSRCPTPKELVINLEDGKYSVLGNASHVRRGEQRQKVLSCLSIEFKEAKDIATLADMADGTCRTVLNDLFGDGLIDRQGLGTRGKAFLYALKPEINCAQNQSLGVCAIKESKDITQEPSLLPGLDPATSKAILSVFPTAKPINQEIQA